MLALERGTAADCPVLMAADRLDVDQAALERWRKYWQRWQLAILKDLCGALRMACFAGRGVDDISKAVHDHCYLPQEPGLAASLEVLQLVPGAAHVIGSLSAYAC